MKHLPPKNKKNNVHIHIEKGFEIINEYLPTNYIEKVKQKLPKNFATNETIRNVRRRIQNPERQIEIFKALIKVSKENKASIEKLIELVN
jgi:hypothetical protein